MSLLDRLKHNAVAEPSPGPAAPHRPSTKPVEIAAEIAERESLRSGKADAHSAPANDQGHGFLQSAHPSPNDAAHHAQTSDEARERTVYLLFNALGFCAIVAAIGSTGSFLVASVAFAITVASALIVVIERPRSLRALYARSPGTATALHAAVLIGALAAWSGVRYQLQALHLGATETSTEAKQAAKLRALREGAPAANARLRALIAEAHAAIDKKDWQRAAAVLAGVTVIEKPYADSESLVQLDPEVLRQLEAAAAQAAERQHVEQVKEANAKLLVLATQVEAAMAAEHWAEAKRALDEALAVQKEKETASHPLDRAVKDRIASLAETFRKRQADDDAKREAQKQLDLLRQAFAKADELAQGHHWSEASNVLQPLLEAIDALPAEVIAQLPADFQIDRFRAQVARRAAQVRSKLPHARARQ